MRRAFERKKVQSDWITEQDRARPAPAPQEPPRAPSRLSAPKERDGSLVSAGPGERPDPAFWDRGIEPEPLGQIAQTYILARMGDELLVIDQHAAHERLVYLQLRRKERTVEAQQLLVPITLELDPAQSETLRDLLPHLAEAGFDIGEFGPRTWAVNSLPADLGDFDPTRLILELIGDMEEARRINALEDLRDKILIRTACHSSIRAGMHVPVETQRELLQQMKRERLSLTCPHGRPTIVRLTKNELDRQFKRIV